jgi:methyltransferase
MEKKRLAMAIPASFISDTPHLREKTAKVGLVGRAAAIFRVDEIVIYRDYQKENQKAELRLVSTLLEYMDTPQYLRKKLFKIDPRMQFVGILPPLRTPHHPEKRQANHLRLGEYVEGIVLSSVKEGLLVDIGVERHALLRDPQHSLGERVTVQIVRTGEPIEVQVANREDISDYWGYRVALERNSIRDFLENFKGDLAVGTSRKGKELADISERFAEKWRAAKSIILVFGAPLRGLHEIAKDEGWKLHDYMDFVVNMIPCQGTETVRTEEAVLAALSVLNVKFGF